MPKCHEIEFDIRPLNEGWKREMSIMNEKKYVILILADITAQAQTVGV